MDDPTIDYVHPDLVNESNSVQDQPESRKCTPINGVLITLVVLAILATIFGFSVIIIQDVYLPNHVQSAIDDSQLTIKQSLLTDPDETSVKLTSTLTSDAKPPYKATISSTLFTFRWCNPTDITVPFTVDYNCTLSSDQTILGQVETPDFDISTSGSSDLNIDSRFEIVNMTAFTQFSKFLFLLPNLTWQAEASMDITVTVMGMKFKAKDISFKKNTTLSGMNSLPGVYTEFFKFFQNATVSTTLPQINLTARVYNQGTTSFIPLGDLRYEYFYALPKNITYNGTTIPYGHIATNVISPNASILSGWSDIPSFGSVSKPEQPGYFYSGLGNLLQNIVNGVNNTEILCFNTHNWDSCCNYTIPPIPPHLSSYFESRGHPPDLLQKLATALHLSRENSLEAEDEDCICTNASSIPLYNNFMQGLVLFMQVRLAGPSPLISQIAINPTLLNAGADVAVNVTFINPFGVQLEIDSVQLNLFYNGSTVVGTYSASGTLPHSKLVVLDPYSTLFYANTKAKFSKDLPQDFIDTIKGGGSIIGSANGTAEFKLMSAAVQINYNQTVLPFLPS